MKIHCDEVIYDYDYPECLRYFILVHRLPAEDSMLILSYKGEPECWATYKGKKVKLHHASSMGLIRVIGDDFNGYICLSELSDFTDVDEVD